MAFDILSYVSDGILSTGSGGGGSDVGIVSVLTEEGASSAARGTRIYITVVNGGTGGVVGLGNFILSDVSWSDTLISGVIPPYVNDGLLDLFVVSNENGGALAADVFTVEASGLDPISQFLTALRLKLQGCSYIEDSANVLIGLESVDLNSTSLTFPRYEVLVTKDKMDGYASQREADFSFRFEIAGYLKRDSNDISFTDMTDLVAFGMETRRLVYSMNDDKQSGNAPCEGFLYMGEYTEVFYEFELFDSISTFLMAAEVHIQISDTEVG